MGCYPDASLVGVANRTATTSGSSSSTSNSNSNQPSSTLLDADPHSLNLYFGKDFPHQIEGADSIYNNLPSKGAEVDCAWSCRLAGYLYMMMRGGDRCWCGNQYGNHGPKVAEDSSSSSGGLKCDCEWSPPVLPTINHGCVYRIQDWDAFPLTAISGAVSLKTTYHVKAGYPLPIYSVTNEIRQRSPIWERFPTKVPVETEQYSCSTHNPCGATDTTHVTQAVAYLGTRGMYLLTN